MINITINGKPYQAQAGDSVLNAAAKHGIEIPTLCHDPRLEPYSSCFVCVVEIEGMRGLQPACSTKVAEGMKLHTDNDKVRKSRKSALDLLVSDHFASCQAPCKTKCPAGVDVQGYISLIEKGLYQEAVELIKDVNPLPAVCGRVCVRPCEAACNRNFMDEGAAVGIDYMKRFVADYDLAQNQPFKPEIAASTGKKVAVIGAGPGGLSAAYFLQQMGHQVDIFEGNNHAGGWLRYGIPEYRLPNEILDKEISTITDLGVNIFYNKKLGENLSYKEIRETYQATILAIGSQRGTLLGADGEDADGVFSGVDFLRNMEQTGQRYDFSGKTVVTVGGGNTAMDCCRTAIRCGAERSVIVYRRTEAEMPANPIEIHESKLEGVEYMILTNPTKVNKNAEGKVESITLIRMELGEPDKSGRRRPVEVAGSEFDLKCDYILAAIGQKTDINFLKDINLHTSEGELRPNKWGDLEADPKTLQTGIPSVFAAGDGVTGPATAIEAIAQAKVAARSVNQYLMGEKLTPKPKEFLSKKLNFAKPNPKVFQLQYPKQMRDEMPVLDADKRLNFNEVELGYTEDMAHREAERCFECGCNEYFTCDLKKYCTEYEAEQTRFAGDFHARQVNFSHPYIEIDNNKCILCSRCIRICDEVAGTTALGLVNRGFDTYVAPSMGKSLTDTTCESCGLCISTCPTGAITENYRFKSGPVRTDSFVTVNPYGGTGEAIEIHHKSGFVMKVSGAKSSVNPDGNIGRQAKFGYQYLNDKSRIFRPLYKENGEFKEISFEKAFEIISQKIKSVKPEENAIFAGARLTNEEQYLTKLLAQTIDTKYVGSFHYLGRSGYEHNSMRNVPFEQIRGASKVYIFGAELNYDDNIIDFLVNNTKFLKHIDVELITVGENRFAYKATKVTHVASYFDFVKAVNHYVVSKGLQNQLFIDGNAENWETYRREILSESYEQLVQQSGVSAETIEKFAEEFNNQQHAVIIFSEKDICGNTSMELQNLTVIIGNAGKTSSGIVALKEKNNAQGLIDNNLAYNADLELNLLEHKFKNIFIFGEDPIGCAVYKDMITNDFKVDFLVVQEAFMSETAAQADLVLPASFHTETDGSFTNSQRVLRHFEAGLPPKVALTNQVQLLALLKTLNPQGFQNPVGLERLQSTEDIFLEAAKHLYRLPEKFNLINNKSNNYTKLFTHGCDYLQKRFEAEFEGSF